MKIKGFTLFELLVAVFCLALLALLTTVSISSIKSRLERQVIIDSIRTAIDYAKIQAVSQGKTVYLTPLDGSKNWSTGMQLIQKNNNKLLHQWTWPYPQWHIEWRGAYSRDRITLSDKPAHSIANGTFLISNVYTHEEVVMVLNRMGKMRIL